MHVGQNEVQCLTKATNKNVHATPRYLCVTRHLLKSSSSSSHTSFHNPPRLSSILNPDPLCKKTEEHQIPIIWAFSSGFTVSPVNHMSLFNIAARSSEPQREWKPLRTRGSHYYDTRECTNTQQPFPVPVIGGLLNAPQLRPQCEGFQPQHIPPFRNVIALRQTKLF